MRMAQRGGGWVKPGSEPTRAQRLDGRHQAARGRDRRTFRVPPFAFSVLLRLWRNEKPQKKPATRRDYETVGYVLAGEAELVVEGQTVRLEPGDSWLVPAGAERRKAETHSPSTEFTFRKSIGDQMECRTVSPSAR